MEKERREGRGEINPPFSFSFFLLLSTSFFLSLGNFAETGDILFFLESKRRYTKKMADGGTWRATTRSRSPTMRAGSEDSQKKVKMTKL